MIAADTSVVVAAFASWHEGHRDAAAALRRGARLPAQVLVESYSVLTRLPPPHRIAPGVAAGFLAARFPEDPLVLSARGHLRLVQLLAEADVPGGAIHDGVVAATAAEADTVLVTRDARALPTYDLVGARYELIG